MLKIAVCCDRVSELEHLYYMTEEYRMKQMGLVVRCCRFQSLYDLLCAVRDGHRFHIYLLDHRSEYWMGDEPPAALLRREDPQGAIVGFTATPGEAFYHPLQRDPLRLSARMLKPVGNGLLEQVLAEIVEQQYPEQYREGKRLAVPVRKDRVPASFRWEDGVVRVPYPNIASVSYKTHAFSVQAINGAVLRSSSTGIGMETLTGELQGEPGFLKLPRSSVVNMDYVAGMDEVLCVVRMQSGDELPVTQRGWKETEETLTAYLKQRQKPFLLGTKD